MKNLILEHPFQNKLPLKSISVPSYEDILIDGPIPTCNFDD